MKDETDISKCKDCGGLEVRKHDGFYPDGRNKRFVNLDGLQWNGRKCPKCVRGAAKSHIKQKRADAKSKTDA